MKLDINFSGLENLVREMGATPVPWTSDVKITVLETDWKINLETKGIDVEIEDIEIAANGLLKYRDEQILLYIKEINNFGHYGLPKFHFYQCATLNGMQKAGRFERYVVTQRKTGYFLMDKKIGYDLYEKDVEEKLDVCGHCLNWFNRNYRKRYDVKTFNIVEFFEYFIKSPITRTPTYNDTNAPTTGYSDNWDLISKQKKEQSGYICQQCSFDLSNHKTLLQTHHVNGVKSDNSITNLKVLCVECHSEQPNHGHIKANKLREILEIRRLKSQNGYNRSLFETIDIEDKYIARIKDKDISPTHAEDKFIFNDKTDQRSSSQSISYESGEKETSTVVVKLLKDDNTNDFEDMF